MRTVKESGRAWLRRATAPMCLWSYAFQHAAKIINYFPRAVPSDENPVAAYTRLFGKDRPDLSSMLKMLHIFGASCYFKDPAQARKFDKFSVPAIYLGADTSKGTHVLPCPSKGKVLCVHQAQIHELSHYVFVHCLYEILEEFDLPMNFDNLKKMVPDWCKRYNSWRGTQQLPGQISDVESNPDMTKFLPVDQDVNELLALLISADPSLSDPLSPSKREQPSSGGYSPPLNPLTSFPMTATQSFILEDSPRTREQMGPLEYSTNFDFQVVTPETIDTPQSWTEALKNPDKENWMSAANNEIKVMHEREVFDLVDPPEDRSRTLGSDCAIDTAISLFLTVDDAVPLAPLHLLDPLLSARQDLYGYLNNTL